MAHCGQCFKFCDVKLPVQLIEEKALWNMVKGYDVKRHSLRAKKIRHLKIGCIIGCIHKQLSLNSCTNM